MRTWTTWNWRDEPDAPRAWGPEPRVVLVEDLHAASKSFAPCAALRASVVDCGVVAVHVEFIETLRMWQEDPCPRFIPALRMERQRDLSRGNAEALCALPAEHHALVITPREPIDLFRIDSSGRDTDRNWIEYTDVLNGFHYAGAYSVNDSAAYQDLVPDVMAAVHKQTGSPKRHVNLVIVKGPTGPDAWPMRPEWVKLLRDQCKNAGVAFAFLGWGDFIPEQECPPEINGLSKRRSAWMDAGCPGPPPQAEGVEGIWWGRPGKNPYREGSKITDWGSLAPNGEYSSECTPWSHETKVYRVGAELAGRKLDGEEHLALPEGL